MVELELSSIPDEEQDVTTMLALLDDFHAKSGVKVHLRRMEWDSAWPELVTFASHDKGPDVSQIGSTWVSSLAMMNGLRPFKPAEVQALGGEQAFIPSSWESTRRFDDSRAWGVPFTGYMHAICYRKDVLARAGVQEADMLGDFPVLANALQKLSESGRAEFAWLNPAIPAPFLDLLHIAAPWVWSAGGEFINEAGTRVLIDSPQAIKGLGNWMKTYRAVPQAYKDLDWGDTMTLFRAGHAAAVLTDIRVANGFVSHATKPLQLENLGVMPLSDVPWVGGGDLVIWQHVLGYPERERAAVELVKFLTNYENSLRWAREVGAMPARMDALQETYPARHPLHAAVMQAARHGRAYRAVPIWRRIEFQIAQGLGACLKDAAEKPTKGSETILREHMEPLVRRLNLTLGN